MEIEEIAKLDLYLKYKNGTQNMLDIDSLIISDNNNDSVNQLRDAAYRLNEINNTASEELKNTWQNLFTKQVRFSVARTKNKRKTDNN